MTDGTEYPLEPVFHGMVGQGAAMQAVFEKILRYGPVDASVLITGETGTGKELIARALHRHGPRRSRAFVALNCSAVNEDLFESELFGHERGAFTGAVAAHKGRFERAAGGTLFLDELGDMPLHAQAKLLRALEHGVVERVGGEREITVDVRVIAATNAALERAVSARRFREDLYHRVAVLRIHAPPLRERVDDLPPLVAYFLRLFNGRYAKEVSRLTPEAMRALAEYRWPGNVRELRNVLERLHVEANADTIGRGAMQEWEGERGLLVAGGWNVDLRDQQLFGGPAIIPGATADDEEIARAAEALVRAIAQRSARPRLTGPAGGAAGYDEVPLLAVPAEVRSTQPGELTADAIRAAYRDAGGNLTAAARRLGVHKATLYRHMQRLGIDRNELDAAAKDD